MNTQEELGGFCFPGPVKAEQVTIPKGVQLYNPWPLLAANPEVNQPRTQPLIRAIYYPSEYPDPFALKAKRFEAGSSSVTQKDLDDFRNFFISFHEDMHLYCLDWTPAKAVARYYLAWCYIIINNLLHPSSEPSLPEVLWRQFLDYTRGLSQIAKKIRLSEELFVTSLTSQLIEDDFSLGKTRQRKRETIVQAMKYQGGFAEEWQRILTESLKHDEQMFPGYNYSNLYERLKPVIKIMLANPYLITLLLQPVWVENEDLMADEYEHINRMIKIVEEAGNTKVAIDRLLQLSREFYLDWHLVLKQYIELAFTPSNNSRATIPAFHKTLWNVAYKGIDVGLEARGSEWERVAAAKAMREMLVSRARQGIGSMDGERLLPFRTGKGSYIYYSIKEDYSDDHVKEAKKDRLFLLFF